MCFMHTTENSGDHFHFLDTIDIHCMEWVNNDKTSFFVNYPFTELRINEFDADAIESDFKVV